MTSCPSYNVEENDGVKDNLDNRRRTGQVYDKSSETLSQIDLRDQGGDDSLELQMQFDPLQTDQIQEQVMQRYFIQSGDMRHQRAHYQEKEIDGRKFNIISRAFEPECLAEKKKQKVVKVAISHGIRQLIRKKGSKLS